MLSDIFLQIKDQWVRAKHQKKHPFRYFVLTTVSTDHRPQARTVVLRDFDSKSLLFTVYTDLRSGKIKDLNINPTAQLLFYDPKKLWQIQVSAHLEKQSTDPKRFLELPPPARKDYTTTNAPRAPILNPEDISYLDNKHHFVALHFRAEGIESLKLKRPHHVRTFFEAHNDWKGTFLTP